MRQKSALGHKWILMYCVIEGEWLKCLVSDNELLELEHLPTTTVKPVGVEVSHTYIQTDRLHTDLQTNIQAEMYSKYGLR